MPDQTRPILLFFICPKGDTAAYPRDKVVNGGVVVEVSCAYHRDGRVLMAPVA